MNAMRRRRPSNRRPFDTLIPLSKSNLPRNPEASAKHPLRRRDIPNIMDRHLALHVGVTRLDLEPKILGDALTDVVAGRLVIGLEGEAVDVHHGHQLATFKKVFVAGVHAAVAAEELDGGGGQVHDKVRDGGRDVDALGLGLGRLLGARGRLGGDQDVLTGLVGFENGVGGVVDEGPAVLAEGADVLGDLHVCMLG